MSEESIPLATFRGVTHRYGELEALSDLHLEVNRGEVFGLLGPNGAGKTTAVRILCGLLAPTAGAASVAGRDVRDGTEARRHLAFVPDGAPLYANLSLRQHLRLVGRLHDLAEGELEARIEHLVQGLDLEGRADEPVGHFSRGMRQKTALACAILPRPAAARSSTSPSRASTPPPPR